MNAILERLMNELNGATFTLIAILLVAFFVTYRLGGITKTFTDFQAKNKDFDVDLRGIKDTLASIKATTELLYNAFLTQAPSSTVQSHSPLSLTEKGLNIAKKVSLEEKVANHWTKIKSTIACKKPVNPYDVQAIAMEVSRECFDTIFAEDEKNEIKLHAFQIGISLFEIYPIIAIIVRDRYLQEQGMNVEDIDKHQPK